jgi:hypothetical protein
MPAQPALHFQAFGKNFRSGTSGESTARACRQVRHAFGIVDCFGALGHTLNSVLISSGNFSSKGPHVDGPGSDTK